MANKSVTVNLRIDPKLKDAAQKKATSMGISLSTVIKNDLRRFVRSGSVRINSGSIFVDSSDNDNDK
jgi:antitoxin component of RelBE/YafQ-DinJ toxin-antitoxin module